MLAARCLMLNSYLIDIYPYISRLIEYTSSVDQCSLWKERPLPLAEVFVTFYGLIVIILLLNNFILYKTDQQ